MKRARVGGRAWTDGAARGNPGAAGFGVVLEVGDRREIVAGFLGEATNNVAEYAALIAALTLGRRLDVRSLVLFSDSQLLVRQMCGEYRVKAAHLKPLYRQAVRLGGDFERIEIRHLGRADNSEADALANRAIDERLPCPEWLELQLAAEKT